MHIQSEFVASVLQIGGHWYVVKVGTNKNCLAILKDARADKKAAEVAAHHFAQAHQIAFIANALIFYKPFVTIGKIGDSWTAFRVFEERFQVAGALENKEEKAIAEAKQIAKKEDLEFFPELKDFIKFDIRQ